MQVSDYLQARCLILDPCIWVKSLSLYNIMVIILTKQPERATLPLLYQSSIAKLSRWPAWVIDDNSYRQEAAADTAKQDRSKLDPCHHAQCFMGMGISSEDWCPSACNSVEHLKHNCPLNSQAPCSTAASRQAL